jgi:hypothetical protein
MGILLHAFVCAQCIYCRLGGVGGGGCTQDEMTGSSSDDWIY